MWKVPCQEYRHGESLEMENVSWTLQAEEGWKCAGREGGVASGSLTCFYCCSVETSKNSVAEVFFLSFPLATRQHACRLSSCRKKEKSSDFYMNSVKSHLSPLFQQNEILIPENRMMTPLTVTT